MEDLKGKRLVTIKILINTETDEFGIDTGFQGFENHTPGLLETRLLSGILDDVKEQVLAETGKLAEKIVSK